MTLNLIYLFIALGSLIFRSNSEVVNKNFIQTSDFSVTIAEHSKANTSLGSIEASSKMALTFLIISQSPQGALQINNSGELSVLDATLFDFEINPQVTAQIQVANESISKTIQASINLTDIDEIEHCLTDSKQVYIDAKVGQWILVTENEYNTLAENLINITYLGLDEQLYNSPNETFTKKCEIDLGSSDDNPNQIFEYKSEATISNVNDNIIPQNSYVFAFKYYSGGNEVSGAKVKHLNLAGPAQVTGLGNALPDHGFGTSYFVLKGSDKLKTIDAESSILGLHTPDTIGMKEMIGERSVLHSNQAQSFLVTVLDDVAVLYQGLGTNTKQWN